MSHSWYPIDLQTYFHGFPYICIIKTLSLSTHMTTFQAIFQKFLCFIEKSKKKKLYKCSSLWRGRNWIQQMHEFNFLVILNEHWIWNLLLKNNHISIGNVLFIIKSFRRKTPKKIIDDLILITPSGCPYFIVFSTWNLSRKKTSAID